MGGGREGEEKWGGGEMGPEPEPPKLRSPEPEPPKTGGSATLLRSLIICSYHRKDLPALFLQIMECRLVLLFSS